MTKLFTQPNKYSLRRGCFKIVKGKDNSLFYKKSNVAYEKGLDFFRKCFDSCKKLTSFDYKKSDKSIAQVREL